MATSVTFNGTSDSIPVVGERQWGTNVSNFLIAVAGNALSKAGGSFVLTTADVNFGTTYGLVVPYIKNSVGNIAASGIIRFANLDTIAWRNAANNADIALRLNASDRLQLGGVDIPTISSTDTLTNKSMSGSTNTFTNLPVGVTGITAIANGGTAVSALPTVQGASAFAAWDANQNLSANNLVNNYVTTATAAGTTTLTVASKYNQFFTGSTTQTVTLPVASTLAVGHQFMITNLSTGVVTVQSSGANSVIAMQPQERALITCILASGTSAASWSVDAELANSSATGALSLPSGTAAQRPTAVAGQVRLNTDSNSFEGYANGAWSSIGGGLNELPQKNYLKTYSDAVVAPTISTTTSTGNITVASGTSAFYTDTGTSLSVSTNSSLRGTTNYLTAVTSFSSTGTAYVQFPAMTLEGTDLGKPMSVSFDVTGNTTSGDWDAVIAEYTSAGVYVGLISIAGTASTCSVTPSALLPTGTTTFNGFFVPSSGTSVFALRLRRLAGAVNPRVDTLFVGNQPIRVGAAITDPISWTPTGSWVSNTTYTGKYTRFGKWALMEVKLALTGAPTATALTVTMPSGMTIDTSATIAFVATDDQSFGTGTAVDSGVNNYAVRVGYQSTTAIRVFAANAAGSYTLGNVLTETVPFTFGNNDSVNLRFWVAISEWSSNITMADRSCEEYVFNTGATITAGASNAAGSTGYGPNGTAVIAVASTTITGNSNTRFICTLTKPMQATDFPVLEVNSGNGWQTFNSIYSPMLQGTATYGIALGIDSATQVSAYFGNAGYTNTGLYGVAGQAWSTITTWKWRIRIVSSGAQVGYPISSANIVGRVDGNAPATGMVGERISATITTTTITTSEADVTGASLALTPGVWEIKYSVSVSIDTGTTVDAVTYASAVITNSSNTEIGSSYRTHAGRTIVAGKVFQSWGCLAASEVVNITANTTYKLRCIKNDNVVVGTASLLNSTVFKSTFYAIRIA